MNIRSFFTGPKVPNFRLAGSANDVLDALEKCLRDRQPLLARTSPSFLMVNALNNLTNQKEEAITYPLSIAGELELNWENTLREKLDRELLSFLDRKERYGEWEKAWGASTLVQDLVDVTMSAKELKGLQSSTRRQVSHSVDQSLYHLVGTYLGVIAVGVETQYLGSLDIICRSLPQHGVPLGQCSEKEWKGWMIAGY